MTLSEIVIACRESYGARFQVDQPRILQYINTIQQCAFNADLFAFLWWEDYLTVYQQLTFPAAGYTNCVLTDVGKTITGNGATGTLLAYNNATRTWIVSLTGNFTIGTSIGLSGGSGSGTLTAQAITPGPYSWAALNPQWGSLTPFTTAAGVRRMLGVTQVTDAQFFAPDNFGQILRINDYGMGVTGVDTRSIYEPVRKYDMQKTLTFINTPSATANTYRWVYFIRPPTIAAITDDVNLLIPPEFHQETIVEGVSLLCNRTTYGDPTPMGALQPVLQPFWDMMQQLYTPSYGIENMTSRGQI